jgi:hypothetical protein
LNVKLQFEADFKNLTLIYMSPVSSPDSSLGPKLPNDQTQALGRVGRAKSAFGGSMSSDPRRFGTADLVVMIGLWSIMAVVLGGVISEVLRDGETPIARAQSEVLAQQMLEANFVESASGEMAHELEASLNSSGSRAPASIVNSTMPALQVKQIGKDPWGRAYHYVSLPHLRAVLVWSSGRNARNESALNVERLISGQDEESFRFSGDDVGVLHRESARTASRSQDKRK